MTRSAHIALTISLVSLLLFFSASAAENALDQNSARILEETKLIDDYWIFLNGHTPIFEQGVFKDPFKVSPKEVEQLIKSNTTSDKVYNSSVTEQFFQLSVSAGKTNPEYRLLVIAAEGLGIRVVEHYEALWEHESGSRDAFSIYSFQEYTRAKDLWVHFYCEKNGQYVVHFAITPNPDVAFPMTGSSEHPSISFTTIKTCSINYHRDFVLTPMDLWGNKHRQESYHLQELIANGTESNITFGMARNHLELKVGDQSGQIIVQPEVLSLDDTLTVGLLGKGLRGGIATATHSLEYTFALDCHNKSGVGKGVNDTDFRKFMFSFIPPPFDRVEIPMWVDCKQFVEGKFFPFNVETSKYGKDVIYSGKTFDIYQKGAGPRQANIPPEVGATEFYIYLEPYAATTNQSEEDFVFDWFERVDVSHTHDILDPEIVNIATRGLAVTKDFLRMVLVYNCKQPGKTNVTVSFLQHDHGYDFNVIKHCPNKVQIKSTSGFWRFLFAAGVIFFGCFLVTVLRALIHKEHSASKDYTPTSTSKRKSETEMSTSTEHSRVQTYDDNI